MPKNLVFGQAGGVKDITIVYPLRAVKKALIYGGLEYSKA